MWTFIIAIASFALYFFHLKESLIFHPDLGNDFYQVTKIAHGNLTLLGPKFTFGGLHGAPYYYYYLLPAFLIGKMQLFSIHVFNAMVFAAALSFFFKQSLKKFPFWKSFFGTATIALSPLYIFGARNPSNATSYMPLILMLLAYAYFNKIMNKWILLIGGFLLGAISNFDFVTFLIFPSILLLIWNDLKDKKYYLYSFLGIALAFSPLLLFELKNNFIMFRNTFIQKSYLSWIENKNMGGATGGKKNIIESIGFMGYQLASYLSVNPLLPLAGFGLLSFKKLLKGKTQYLFFGALLSLLILSVLIRFQYAQHYLFPTGIFLLFAFVIMILETKFAYLIGLFLLLELLAFPKYQYDPSYRKPETFEKAVDYVIHNKLIDKHSNFNVVQVTNPTFLAMLGFEYRSYFENKGYHPRSEFEFSDSDVLLVFTDIPSTDPQKISSWEIDKFGKEHLKKTRKYKAGTITIYKVEK